MHPPTPRGKSGKQKGNVGELKDVNFKSLLARFREVQRVYHEANVGQPMRGVQEQ